jgi:transcriptional regulator with XRE-family HTH domain
MDGTGPTIRAGQKLKQLRERLGLTLREVEAHSQRLAQQKQNQDFFISRGWLNNIENGTNTPSLFKLYALGAIYREHWSSIFSLFGCNLSDFGRDQAMFSPPKTQLAADSAETEETIVLPLRSREDLRLDRTHLLSRLGEIWGEIPIRLIQHLDLRDGPCTQSFAQVPLSKLTRISARLFPPNGKTNTSVRSISSNCAGNTSAAGARCERVTCLRFRIRIRSAKSAGFPTPATRRSWAASSGLRCASPKRRRTEFGRILPEHAARESPDS